VRRPVQVAQARLAVQMRPQGVDDLLARQPVAGGEREQLHEVGRTPPLPRVAAHAPAVRGHLEAPEQPDIEPLHGPILRHRRPVASEGLRKACPGSCTAPPRKDPVFPGNRYIIRAATDDDAADLLRLAQLDSAPPLIGRVLVGELDGTPAAALSLADDRVVADPYRPTAQLRAHLRLRAQALKAYAQTPSLRERLIAALRPAASTA